MTSGLGSAALVAVIAIVPLVVLMLTSFVKISVVLSLLRNAIGAPDAPSGLVVMGLSLILTFFVMAPVAIDMVHAAAEPVPATPGPSPSPSSPSPLAPSLRPMAPTVPAPGSPAPPTEGTRAGSAEAPDRSAALDRGGGTGATASRDGAAVGDPKAAAAPAAERAAPGGAPAVAPGGASRPIDLDGAIRELVPAQYRPQVDAASRAVVPLRGFLARHASARDRETFTGLAIRMGRVVQGDEVWVLGPAFVTTELREAFAIAVLIFVPFLVIDLVVGLGLAALGLSSTSPQAIALPLKLLLFVSVDGWRLLIDGLLRGYA
jgi:type III secretion protein R